MPINEPMKALHNFNQERCGTLAPARYAHGSCMNGHGLSPDSPEVLPPPLMAQSISEHFRSHLDCWPTSHSLSWTLICSYYLSLLDTLDSPCLHFDPQPSTLTSASHPRLSDSVPDNCIVAEMVGTPQLDF